MLLSLPLTILAMSVSLNIAIMTTTEGTWFARSHKQEPPLTWSQREQSEPGVPGHAEHAPLRQVPPATDPSPGKHLCGVVALSCVPDRQQGPSSVGGIGMSDQVDPGGEVPSLTKVVCDCAGTRE